MLIRAIRIEHESTLMHLIEQTGQPIRVLVVDDSTFMRNMLSMMLRKCTDIDVVGTAMNGHDAINQAHRLQPDVMTLDIEMPDMNGLEVLDYMMAEHPLPIIMVSALTEEGADVTLRALERGAVNFITKPMNQASSEIRVLEGLLQSKVREAFQTRHRFPPMAHTGIQPKRGKAGVVLEVDARTVSEAFTKRSESNLPKTLDETVKVTEFPLVVIGASTGGPNLLFSILRDLPSLFPAAVLIVQHMPKFFTKVFAENLHAVAAFPVHEAEDGVALQPGVGFVVPGDQHAVIIRDGDGCPRIQFVSDSGEYPYRPSIDCTMISAAEQFGPNLVGLVVTGMGNDGLMGSQKIKDEGGTVLVQNEATSLIYGMPRAVAEAGLADAVLPDVQIAANLVEAVGSSCEANR